MDEKARQHWTNKVARGKSTLKDFCEEYDLINGSGEQFTVASTQFPTGNVIEGFMEFEWVIYYKVSPHQPVNKPVTPEVIID